MGKVIIMPETTKNPISLIGRCAGICWGANVEDEEKNYKRGIDCIQSDHGRTMEFPDIYAVIEGYSAKVIREWYTHIGGLPTRLQASTRYINYENFNYVIPKTIQANKDAFKIYVNTMQNISKAYIELEKLGIPHEDSSFVLPFGMETKIIDKRNMRSALDMSRQRMCKRAYYEFRDLFDDYLDSLREYSDEWKTAIDMTMMPKCEVLGYCSERKSCGRKPKKNI